MKKAKVYIGTSGYSYDHWQKIFYPKSLPKDKWLEYYAKFFKTVELNVTFYHLPKESTFKNWREKVPENFIFICKGSRYITHVKKLKDVKQPVILFFKRAKVLQKKLGAILWQLPPNWNVNIKRLEEFLKICSKHKIRQAFEFRNKTWFCPEVYELLEKYGMALVVADSPQFPSAEKVTADFVYLRFHGSQMLYSSNYSQKELKFWAGKIKNWLGSGLNVYAYFNNDSQAFAAKNAQTLKTLLN